MTTPTPPPEPADELVAELHLAHDYFKRLAEDDACFPHEIEKYERRAKAVRDAISLLTTQQRELAELRNALEMGQRNCDDVYNDLKRERDVAKSKLSIAVREHAAELAAVKEAAKHTEETMQFFSKENTSLHQQLGEASGHYSSLNASYQQMADEFHATSAQVEGLRNELAELRRPTTSGDEQEPERVTKARKLMNELNDSSDECLLAVSTVYEWEMSRENARLQRELAAANARVAVLEQAKWVGPCSHHYEKLSAEVLTLRARLSTAEAELLAARKDGELIVSWDSRSRETVVLICRADQQGRTVIYQGEGTDGMWREGHAATPPGAKE